MRLHGRLQVLWECGRYIGWHRACPSDSQEAILVRARSISEFRVAKADLRSSARVVLCQGVNLKCDGPALNRFGTPISSACNAPVPRAALDRARHPYALCEASIVSKSPGGR